MLRQCGPFSPSSTVTNLDVPRSVRTKTCYKSAKMLSVNGWPSTATQAKTTLAQAPKSKESLAPHARAASRFAQSKLSIRVVERNDVLNVAGQIENLNLAGSEARAIPRIIDSLIFVWKHTGSTPGDSKAFQPGAV
jgi:hypothetical protein